MIYVLGDLWIEKMQKNEFFMKYDVYLVKPLTSFKKNLFVVLATVVERTVSNLTFSLVIIYININSKNVKFFLLTFPFFSYTWITYLNIYLQGWLSI